MKKIISLTLAMLLTFAVSSCGSTDKQTTATTAKAAENKAKISKITDLTGKTLGLNISSSQLFDKKEFLTNFNSSAGVQLKDVMFLEPKQVQL